MRALLEHPDWAQRAAAAAGPVHAVDGLDYAPLVPAPEKILCIGQNYADHIAEMGNEPPEYPTVFAKFAPALVGAHDDIVLPAVSDAVDYEAELAVVIGRPVRHATPEQAQAAIAGYTVLNDVSARDWQFRTSQYLQGKTFERSTPLGPCLVTPDELPDGRLGDQHRDRRGDPPALHHRGAGVRRPSTSSPTSRRSSRSTPATSSRPARPAASGTAASPRVT